MKLAAAYGVVLAWFFPLAAIPLVHAAPQAEAPRLLGVSNLFTGCGTSLTGITSIDFRVRMLPSPVLYFASVNETNMAALSGQTLVYGPDSGAPFFQTVELLTNGVSDRMELLVDLNGIANPGGSCTGTRSEVQAFDFFLACPNGVDFGGAILERLELHIESLVFGPSYLGVSSLLVYGELSVYGRDPAPCLPPRFQVRLQPGTPVSGSLQAAREEAAGGGDGERWRLWVEHLPEVAGTPAEPLADLVLVSRRALELPLAAGTLYCDPSPEALILLRAVAPGRPVELGLPPTLGPLDTLHVQAATLDAGGRLRLTDALALLPPVR